MKEDPGNLGPGVLRDNHRQCNEPVGAGDVFSLTEVPFNVHWGPLGFNYRHIEVAALDLLGSILHWFVKMCEKRRLNLQCGKSYLDHFLLLSIICEEVLWNRDEIWDSAWGGHHVPRWPQSCSLSTIRRMELGVDSGFQSSPYQGSMFWAWTPLFQSDTQSFIGLKDCPKIFRSSRVTRCIIDWFQSWGKCKRAKKTNKKKNPAVCTEKKAEMAGFLNTVLIANSFG